MRLMATQAAISGAGRLVGKVVFITGAAQGIGRATALVGVCTCADYIAGLQRSQQAPGLEDTSIQNPKFFKLKH